jgi:hypothetical protein
MPDAIAAGAAAGIGIGIGIGVGAMAVGVSATGAVAAESFDFVAQPVVISTAATAATHKTRTSFFKVFIRRSPGGFTAIWQVDTHNSRFILHHCRATARTLASETACRQIVVKFKFSTTPAHTPAVV